jgi:hypothetical protein
MSHRRPEPRQAVLERTLRHTLRMAANSVEPGDDGLARIRAKIAAGQPAPRVRWWTTPYARVLAAVALAWYYLEPAAIWLRYAAGDVAERLRYIARDIAYWLRRVAWDIAERFRPDLGRGGWVRWLRPAAGLATVLLVVTGVSWAVTGLQQTIVNLSNPNGVGGGGGSGGSTAAGPSHHASSYPYASRGSSGRTGSQSALAAVSCRASSGSPSPSPSASPTGTPSSSSSPSQSPSQSPSSSPSSSTSSSASPSPSSSPSSMVTGSPSSAQAADPARRWAAARQLAAAEQTIGRATGPQSSPRVASRSKLANPDIGSRCA